MCGISGFIDIGGATPDASGVLRRMNRRLSHRGPDAEGYFESANFGASARLGHRRLSVIDIAASTQPMRSADGHDVLVYNGETYNFAALRTQLQASGHAFRTQGDTEVVLQMLAAHGEAALPQLQGMFAFAHWNQRTQTLLCGRDPLGIKPFYYFWDGTVFAFASELKALLEHPRVSRELDLDAISLYLECQYIPTPLTIYKHIRKLPAAHGLRLQNGSIQTWQYWNPTYATKPARSEAEALDELDRELRASVASMLVADVPLGAFVSGGIDSSLVAALMTDITGKPIDSFNLGFLHAGVADTAQSEHVQAQRVADHLGSHHHSLMVSTDDVLKAFDSWVDVFDEPFGDQAALPTMLLSQLTRQHVTVALTGEGADELFSGYANYHKRVREERISGLLGATGSPVPALVKMLPAAARKDRLLKAIAAPLAERYATIPNVFDAALQKSVYAPAFAAATHRRIASFAGALYAQCDSASYLEKIMYVDMRLWLPDDLLTKVDRATMAHSLEARVPYLDHKFVEFVATLDPSLKQNGKTTKYLLKKLAEKYLPHDIVYRPKQGFVMPLSEWIASGLKTRIEESLGVDDSGSPRGGGLSKRGLFREGTLEKLFREHRAGRSNHAGRLWALTVLELWFQRYEPDFRIT